MRNGVAVMSRVSAALRRSDRVDDRVRYQLAVEDADLLLKAQAIACGDYTVEIAARIEHFAGAVTFGADDEIIGLDRQGTMVATRYSCRADDVTLIIRRVKQRALHTIDAIHQRAPALKVHRAQRQAAIVIFAGDDLVPAILREKPGPLVEEAGV